MQNNGRYTVQGHPFQYQWKAHVQLPMCNLPPILHHFRDMADYWYSFCCWQWMHLFDTSLGWTSKRRIAESLSQQLLGHFTEVTLRMYTSLWQKSSLSVSSKSGRFLSANWPMGVSQSTDRSPPNGKWPMGVSQTTDRSLPNGKWPTGVCQMTDGSKWDLLSCCWKSLSVYRLFINCV